MSSSASVSGGGGGASGSRMSSSGAVVCGGGFMDVVGDLDLSGGGVSGLDDSGKNSGSVMSEMRALFTPPGRDSRRHQSYMQLQQPGHAFQMHPYYKRPGKGHNHDCCDACGEGGDLICCDSCPASFHFSCHAPPLEEDDIPMGDWACLRCYVREKSRNDAIKAANNIPVTTSVAATTSIPTDDNGGAASPTTAWPVSAEGKGGKSRGRPARGTSAKKQLESVLKTEKEKAIKKYKLKYDKYLVVKPITNSPFDILIAATQVSNAEQFKLPAELEPHESLPFSWKWSDEREDDLDSSPRNCANCFKTSRGIPSIACDFCPNIFHLDCLDPPLAEIPRDRWMCTMHPENFIDQNMLTSTSLTERLKLWQKYAKKPVDTETVRLEFFRKVRSGKLFQKSRVKRSPLENRVKVPQFVKDQYNRPMPGYPADVQVPPQPQLKSSDDAAADRDGANEFIASLVSMQQSLAQSQTEAIKKEIEEKANRRKKLKAKRKRKTAAAAAVGKGEKEEEGKRDVKVNGEVSAAIDDERMDDDSEDTDSECSLNLDSLDGLEISDETHAQLNSYLVKSASHGLDYLSPVVRDFLALQKMKEVFNDAKDNAAAGLPHPTHPTSEVQARAALVPLHISKVPCLMRYRTLDIGVGAGLALDLSKYGHCNYVSPRHASIYFDQYSLVYELINYSEHGTIVDNAIYALDCRDVAAEAATTPKRSQKKQAKAAASNDWKRMAMGETGEACHCDTSAAMMLKGRKGCENSAILHHGSYIRIGCSQFVFSIMDYLGGANLGTNVEEVKREKVSALTSKGKEVGKKKN